jgi:hypothetical protein
MMCALSISAGTIATTTSADRQLKYEIKAPERIVNAYRATEIWVRGHEAMRCSFSQSRAAIKVDRCEPLREVAQ